MRRTLTAVGLGLAVATALAGCGDDDEDGASDAADETPTTASAEESDPAEPTEESDPTESSSAPGEPPATDAPVVTVVAAGEAPGRLLEFDLEQGQRDTAVMRVEQVWELEGMGRQDVPPMSMSFTTEVVDVTDAGYVMELTYGSATVEGHGVPAEDVRRLEESLAGLEGVSGEMTFRRDGSVTDSEIDVPAGADPMLATMLQQIDGQVASMATPLPDEPVGPGAVWESRATLELNGIEMTGTTTYTLEEVDGDELQLAFETDQAMQPGPLPGGELISGEGLIEGSTTMSLRQMTPVASTAEGSTEMVMESMGQEMAMEIVMKVQVTTGD